jgi:hypothetical protein
LVKIIDVLTRLFVENRKKNEESFVQANHCEQYVDDAQRDFKIKLFSPNSYRLRDQQMINREDESSSSNDTVSENYFNEEIKSNK